jgi:hypothetical protein
MLLETDPMGDIEVFAVVEKEGYCHFLLEQMDVLL